MALPTIPPELWGRDHWSFLAFATTRVGEGGSLPADGRLRLDGARHPTRLQTGAVVYNHNDLDCLSDLEHAGVLRNTGSRILPRVQFTPMGLVLGQWLCAGLADQTIRTSGLTWTHALQASGADKVHP